MLRRFELDDGSSRKFWEIDLEGSAFRVRFGRLGTRGQEQQKSFASEDAARAEHDKLVREKVKKGYAEQAGAPPATLPAAAPPAPAAPAPAPVAFDAAAFWAGVAAHFAPFLPALGRGVARAPGGLGPRLQAVGRLLEARATVPPPGPLDVEDEAVLAAVVGLARRAGHYYDHEGREFVARQGSALVAAWTEAAGLPFALRAAFLSGACEPESAHGASGWGRDGYVAGVTVWAQPAIHWQLNLELLRALRAAVAAAGPDEYAHARAEGERLRGEPYRGPAHASEENPLVWRCCLAYVFPREREWAEADARDWLAYSGTHWSALGGALLGTRLEADTLAAIALRTTFALPFLEPLVDHLADAAAPVLAPLVARAGTKDVRVGLAEALARVEGPQCAALLAGLLTDQDTRAIASRYFGAHPKRALLTLLPLAAAGGEAGEAALGAAATVVGTHPEAADAVRAQLPRAAADALDALRARLGAGSEAAPAELPRVLADPPWLGRKKKAAAGTVVAGLTPLPRAESLRWAPGEREMHLRTHPSLKPAAETDAERVRDVEERVARGETLYTNALDAITDEPALRLWATIPAAQWRFPQLPRVLARFGVAGLGPVLELVQGALAQEIGQLARVDSPRVAPLMAEALARLRSQRALAQEWLFAHPETAAVGLVPRAVGPLGPERDHAGAALRLLAGVDRHAATVRAAGEQYGAQAALDEVLAFDPLLLFPAKLPKLPEFWQPAALPRPRMRSGGALPAAALEHLGTMLAFSPVDPPYAGLAQVREACDPRSLAEFAWALFQQWLLAGAPPKEKWAFFALGHLGHDETSRRLVGLLRDWASEAPQRAVMGLDVLAIQGTDTAMRLLFGLSEKAKRGLRQGAEEKLQEIATRRGLTPADLADRLVPDFDLDPDGSTTLDFGPRQFKVGFDEALQPFVKDAAGKRLKELPAPGAADEAEKAKAAAERWKELKKETRKLATEQVRRLEVALGVRRRWAAADFRTLLVEHPLLVHLVRRLVWAAYHTDGRLAATFRLAEDGTFAGRDDQTFTLAPEATVGIAHPLELGPEDRAAWPRILADYEIVQPFPQLGRPVYERTEAEAAADVVVVETTVPLGRLLGLERRGWRKGPPESRGASIWFEKPVPGFVARVFISPGLGGAEGMPAEQKVHHVSAHGAGLDYAPRLPLGALDPVLYSELMYDVAYLRG